MDKYPDLQYGSPSTHWCETSGLHIKPQLEEKNDTGHPPPHNGVFTPDLEHLAFGTLHSFGIYIAFILTQLENKNKKKTLVIMNSAVETVCKQTEAFPQTFLTAFKI